MIEISGFLHGCNRVLFLCKCAESQRIPILFGRVIDVQLGTSSSVLVCPAVGNKK